MRSSLTTLVVLVTLLHVAVFTIMIMIRLRRDDAGATASTTIRPCAVCGEPAAQIGYDGLDPHERRDPHTGRAYSTDMTHYQPLCAAHPPQPVH